MERRRVAPRPRRQIAPGNNSDDEGATVDDYLEAVRAQAPRGASRSPRPGTRRRPRSPCLWRPSAPARLATLRAPRWFAISRSREETASLLMRETSLTPPLLFSNFTPRFGHWMKDSIVLLKMSFCSNYFPGKLFPGMSSSDIAQEMRMSAVLLSKTRCHPEIC